MRILGIRGGFTATLVSSALAASLATGVAHGLPPGAIRPPGLTSAAGNADAIPGIRATHTVAPAALYAALAKLYVPSFSRQTGLACSACHFQFPQLTPFGRLFKLNGYTLTSLSTIGQPGMISPRVDR